MVVAALIVWCPGFPSPATVQESNNASSRKAKADLPPIECPLHKAGIDPTKLKPFEEVEKYIQFLERPDRAKWQNPDEVVKALGLNGSETVVDLGGWIGFPVFLIVGCRP